LATSAAINIKKLKKWQVAMSGVTLKKTGTKDETGRPEFMIHTLRRKILPAWQMLE